ncbi:hypothetical protein [Labilibaculum euxinus]
MNFGGPNFVIPNSNQILFSGRDESSGKRKTILGVYNFSLKEYMMLLELPSEGDCGYPGMFLNDDILWLSYYSSHENVSGSSIYLAKIKLLEK